MLISEHRLTFRTAVPSKATGWREWMPWPERKKEVKKTPEQLVQSVHNRLEDLLKYKHDGEASHWPNMDEEKAIHLPTANFWRTWVRWLAGSAIRGIDRDTQKAIKLEKKQGSIAADLTTNKPPAGSWFQAFRGGFTKFFQTIPQQLDDMYDNIVGLFSIRKEEKRKEDEVRYVQKQNKRFEDVVQRESQGLAGKGRDELYQMLMLEIGHLRNEVRAQMPLMFISSLPLPGFSQSANFGSDAVAAEGREHGAKAVAIARALGAKFDESRFLPTEKKETKPKNTQKNRAPFPSQREGRTVDKL